MDLSLKILFLQHYITEKRYGTILTVLEESIHFLENELKKRGIITDKGLLKMRVDLMSDFNDIEASSGATWIPSNFINGDWKQRPVRMD